MKERLTYHVPSLGNAAITLHDESAELYRFLQLSGEVVRLNQLDHLGLVRVAWSGAHHPRWEYVVTILHLIGRCKESSDIHMNTRVVLPSGSEVSSGAELLRCWALLSNVGHLHETFSAEAALLDELSQSRKARAAFLGEFDGDRKKWAQKLLAERRIYSFFQALTVIRLRELATAVGISDATRSLWEDMFFLYLIGGGDDQLVLLKRIYRNLRRLAYIGLDGHYVPAVVGLDLPQVTSDIPAFTRLVLRDDASNNADDELRALEQYLYREFYMGRPVLEAVAARDRRLRELIRRSIRSNGFHSTLDQLARDVLQEAVLAEEINCVVRLSGWSASPVAEVLLEEVDVRQRRRETLRDRASMDLGVRPIWWQAAYGGDWVFQTHAPPNAMEARAYAYSMAFREAEQVARRAYEQWREFIKAEILDAWVSERHATELIESALRLIFSADVRWEWRRLHGETTALLVERGTARERFRRHMRRKDIARARSDELRAAAILLRRRPSEFAAVSLVNLVGYEGFARSPVVELDGVIVEIVGVGRVRLTLIEAKRHRSRAQSTAVNHLQRTIRKLVTHSEVSVGSIASFQDGAFAYACAAFEVGIKSLSDEGKP